jgi:DNA-binding LacI/PurR family transcriptional regulator
MHYGNGESMGSGSVTTIEIARKVGVAQSTVANILNRKPGFKYAEETRKKVLDVADALGYHTKVIRRAIKQSLRQFGFLVSSKASIESTFMYSILSGVYKATFENGYSVMLLEAGWRLGDIDDAKEKTKKLIDLVQSRVLDGLLVDKSRFETEQMEMLEDAKVPFVCINGMMPAQIPSHQNAYWVCIDHEQGARLAVNYLLKEKHRRIAMVNPEMSHYPTNWLPAFIGKKIEGYKNALKQAGVEFDDALVREASTTNRDMVCQAVDDLLKLQNPPTAIFAADDSIAILCMNHLRRAGIRVPEDISVMGYGDWQAAFLADPPLTTVSVPWARMGELGAQILMLLIADGKDIKKQNVLNAQVKYGASVAPPKVVLADN